MYTETILTDGIEQYSIGDTIQVLVKDKEYIGLITDIRKTTIFLLVCTDMGLRVTIHNIADIDKIHISTSDVSDHLKAILKQYFNCKGNKYKVTDSIKQSLDDFNVLFDNEKLSDSIISKIISNI